MGDEIVGGLDGEIKDWVAEWCFSTHLERLAMCARGRVPGWVYVVIWHLGCGPAVLEEMANRSELDVVAGLRLGRCLHRAEELLRVSRRQLWAYRSASDAIERYCAIRDEAEQRFEALDGA